MAIIYSKTADNKLAATEVKEEVNIYNYELLLEQRKRFEREMESALGYLNNVNKLIEEADKLGVKATPIKD